MLSTLDGDQVQLRLSAPNRAGLVIPNENERDEDITMLIMPMMLNNY
jgi:DNA polymerase-3 subunit beta